MLDARFLERPRSGEEFHDTGIGIQPGEWLAIGFAPTPKNQPFSFCYKHVNYRSNAAQIGARLFHAGSH
jgi:hypothetical protein